MALAVEEDESPNPAHICLFGSQAVVLRAEGDADQVKETWLMSPEFDRL